MKRNHFLCTAMVVLGLLHASCESGPRGPVLPAGKAPAGNSESANGESANSETDRNGAAKGPAGYQTKQARSSQPTNKSPSQKATKKTKYPVVKSWPKLMSDLVSPFEDMCEGELSKEGDADFTALESEAKKIAFYFSEGNNYRSVLFFKDPKRASNANVASKWFTKLANAAATKDHKTMAKIFVTGRKKTCTLCHD